MPRLRRVEVDGAIDLVTARGEASTPLFQDPQDYDTYLKLLAEQQTRYGFRLFAYCLLPDAVLLAIEPAAGSTLSEIMHDLTTCYSRYANKRHARTGPLFRERFKQAIVESQTHLLPLASYLHLLPVQRGLAQEAQGYPFSSAQRYATPANAIDRLDMDEEIQLVLRALPPETGYAQHLSRISAAEQHQLQRIFASRIVGSTEFVSRVKAALARPLPETRPAEIIAAVPSMPSLAPAAAPRSWRSLGIVMASLAAVAFSAVLVGSLQRQLGSLKQTLAAITDGQGVAGYSLAIHRNPVKEFASLEGTEWDVRLMPLHAMPTNAKTQDAISEDSLAFSQKHMTAHALGRDGFSPSRYTMALQPDGTLNWETMQVNPSGETLLWQGEWQGPSMRGVVTRQARGEQPQHFTFVGVSRTPTAGRSET